MFVGSVLTVSILLQILAALLALRLIRVTQAGRAWTLIALAVLLMAVRRGLTLYRLASGDLAHPPDLAVELLSLTISLLMVLGIAGIGSLFVSARRAKDALKEAHDHLESRVAQRTDELAAATRRLEESNARRKHSERELLELAARQQRQMGQELHDGLGQQLLGLRLMADSLVRRLAAQGRAETPAARELADALLAAQHSVRALIKGIRPVEVDARGLMTGLADLAEHTERVAGISCLFHCDQPADVNNNHTAMQLFYIVQEAVGNAVRHAQAQHIEIGLSGHPQQLELWVRDDGQGIAGDMEQTAGMGLRIMQHRAAVIGAELTIHAAPSGGTLVTCVVPCTRV
jgi:signal transduction histidine kinase